jgi:uncharacterized protein YbjT (DUF2867 family)
MAKQRRQAPVRVLVAGATGLVGHALLARLVRDPRVCCVTALLRRQAQAASLPGGVAPLVLDVQQLAQAGAPALPAANWAFCCLGTTIKQAGSQAAFRAIDHDAVLAFASAARAAGASRLALVSAMGADAGSTVFYNRVKGEVEDALRAQAWPQLLIARPSLLLGERSALGQPMRPGERLAQALMPTMGWLLPRRLRPIRAEAVATALLDGLAETRKGMLVLDSAQLQVLADRAKAR